MELIEFRALTGRTLEEVASAVGSSKGRLSKIERKLARPDAALMLRLNAWSDRERRRIRLPVSKSLDWSYLLEDDDPKEAS